jgi:hypothetical protein
MNHDRTHTYKFHQNNILEGVFQFDITLAGAAAILNHHRGAMPFADVRKGLD